MLPARVRARLTTTATDWAREKNRIDFPIGTRGKILTEPIAKSGGRTVCMTACSYSSSRRAFIQSGILAAGGVLYPWAGAFAQSRSLLRSPKRALVIGNSRYKQSPLRNPSNDAKAIAEALKRTGFDVTLGLEMSHAEMSEAIRAYVASLGKSKPVGLFYFAGHGVQLAWRNYLVPIDAEIVNIEQVRERAIDVNSVIDGLRKAANPMNMIILDACRDNPFGATMQGDQRGLSQLDAPPTTLLAYATAPGHTAADGQGEHGLYTEHLLREMVKPDAKVEDVFKRVRLEVRRRSNGRQIPWESTSLEEDFWFVPPAQVKKLAEAEAEREFQLELAFWEKAKGATQAGPLEEYLRRYPSGRFSELAQLKLDQALARQGEQRIEVVTSALNPYTHGTVRPDTAYRVRDAYSYRWRQTLTRLEPRTYTHTVTDVTDGTVIFNEGSVVTDLLGNRLKLENGTTWSANQLVPAEFTLGKRWNTRFETVARDGTRTVADLEVRVVNRRSITVPAGTFNAFQVEAYGYARGTSDNPFPSSWHGNHPGQTINSQWHLTTWFAPEQSRRTLAWEWRRGERHELTSFRQS